eukprot:scaffold1868_cov193-Cylindrotheca_fusiformis.AAC.23
MANIFVHFEPIGAVGDEIRIDPDLPGYVIPGSAEEAHWRANNPRGYKLVSSKFTSGSTATHSAAGRGQTAEVRQLLQEKPHHVNHRDTNGWMPLHEAVRGGHVETVALLLEHGADINSRTKARGKGAAGGSALWWAIQSHGEEHAIVQFLRSNGAKLFAPGQEHEEL